MALTVHNTVTYINSATDLPCGVDFFVLQSTCCMTHHWTVHTNGWQHTCQSQICVNISAQSLLVVTWVNIKQRHSSLHTYAMIQVCVSYLTLYPHIVILGDSYKAKCETLPTPPNNVPNTFWVISPNRQYVWFGLVSITKCIQFEFFLLARLNIY